MATKVVKIETFGGLNLATSADQAGAVAAVDLLNVDVSKGDLRTRPGLVKRNTNTLSSTGYDALFPSSEGKVIAVRRDGVDDLQLDVLDVAGGLTNIGSVALAGVWNVRSFAALGTPTTTLVYITLCAAATGYTIVKYNTGAGTVAAATGKPTLAATWPTSNRLVQGGFFAAADSPTGANGSRSTVFFSDAGAPDTFGANNFVTLRPGDGEGITAIVPWGDLLLVFKQTSVFVFYGESVDGGGNPVFNYRRVDLPDAIPYDFDSSGSGGMGSFVAAGRAGVLFSTYSGVYMTTGGPAVSVTDAVRGVFSRDPSISSSLLIAAGTNPPKLSVCGRWLLCDYLNTGVLQRTLVLDMVTGRWSVWSLPSSSDWHVPLPVSTAGLRPPEEFLFPVGNDLYLATNTVTTDAGSPISWSYKTGRYQPGGGSEVVAAETSLVGSGTVTLTMQSDLTASGQFSSTSASATLGVAPAVLEGWPSPVDVQGTWLQSTLSGSASAAVTEIRHHVGSVEGASNAR